MISKNNTMLQFPVEKQVAKDFKGMAKSLGVSQGELFTASFSLMVIYSTRLQEKGKKVFEENYGNKENN